MKVDNEYDMEDRPGSIESGNPLAEKEEEEVEPSKVSKIFWMALKALVWVGLLAYTIAAFVHDSKKAVTLIYFWIFILIIVGSNLAQKYKGDSISGALDSVNTKLSQAFENKAVSITVGVLTVGIIALIVGLSVDDASRLVSVLGLFVFVLLTWATSWKPRQVKWRPVIGGLLFQLVFGLLIMRTDVGFNVFDFFGKQITVLLDYTKAGSSFVFGYLANAQMGHLPLSGTPADVIAWTNQSVTGDRSIGASAPSQTYEVGLVFAVSILPTVIFFSALVSMLYYLGILQVIIRVIGRILAFLLGTSASESLNAAGNIFVGQTEAPLLVRPFLKDMTESEIHAVMTGGFATIAGGVLAIYISFNIPASQLLAASVMSAPAALAISKLAYPETEESKTAAGAKYDIELPDQVNVIEAAASGAAVAVQLCLNIGGQLIAFLALLAMFNAWLAYFGAYIGQDDLSFEKISGWVFWPFAWLMGADADDCSEVATLIGLKIFANEFVAYLNLAGLIATNAISVKSQVVATYALCGFSNFGSIGIQIGGLTPLAPNKAKSIAKLVFSAMIAGNTACFMTACVAGLLYDVNRL